MRSITLVVLLFAALACAFEGPLSKMHEKMDARNTEDTCATVTCATTGQTCGVTSTSPPTLASCTSANTYCASSGASLTGSCTATKANGQACSSGSECTNSACIQGVCASSDIANGGACTSSIQCDSNNCVNSVCTGASVGQTCTSSSNCNIDGTNCVGGVCTMPLNIGAACSVNNDQCADGLLCGAASTCVVYYSVASGAACNNNPECQQGLACINSVCSAVPASSNTACTDDSACSSSTESCECNYNNGQGKCTTDFVAIPSGANSISSQIRSCYTGACASTPTSNCILDKCRSAYCAVENLSLNYIKSQYKTNYPSCFASAIDRELNSESVCGGSSSAVGIAASTVVLAFAATVTIALGL